MSTQNRNSGGGGNSRSQKKSNAGNGGLASETVTHATSKKSDATKTEKEKAQPKPTPEQLRIAQITNSNAAEDPQMREKVATLIEMTERSEEEVCCALYECDNNLERAVVFLLETLPVGAFATSSKKKKKQAATPGQDGAGGDADGWNDVNANTDRREKSRNRSSNRGGRGGTDSRGWRGREARENERNLRESRGGDRERGEREDRANDNRGGQRGNSGSARSGGLGSGSGRGGGYPGRTGRGGGRMGGRMSGLGRGDRNAGGGGYGARQNATLDDHQEVELWDNTIAQNAEKQQQAQDDAWGDWDNEEYVGSLKDSKVFTTSNLPNQTAASVVSGGLDVGVVNSINNVELGAPPGLESHLVSSAPIQQSTTHLEDCTNNISVVAPPSTPMQYSAALAGTPLSQVVQSSVQQTPPQQQTQGQIPTPNVANSGLNVNAPQYNSVVADSFTNAANAAASLVQQVQAQQQQTQTPGKTSSTLSAEQSQYFNSLTSQNVSNNVNVTTQQTPQINAYVQNAGAGQAGVQYPSSYANVFGSTAGANSSNVGVGIDHQQPPVQQVRRPRSKLPPPSKIPSTAVEMPGDSLNNMTYLDVQFGGLDFGSDDSFDALSDKFNSSVNIDNQTSQQSLVQSAQDVNNDYQNKASVQQQSQSSLTASLQNAQIGDTLSGAYGAQRAPAVGQQQQVVGGAPTNVGGTTLEQLTKNEHVYNQANVNNTGGYQSAYQTNSTNKVTSNAYQQSAAAQGYSTNAYGNVQASVANSYQAQTYGSYQQNAVNSYQQTGNAVPGAVNNGTVSSNSTQNIPVGSGNSNSATSINSANSNASYLSAGYPTQQSAYQTSQSVYGSTGLSNSSGFAVSSNNSTSQYSNYSTSAKLKDATSTSNTSHFESVSTNNNNTSGSVASSVSSSAVSAASGPNANAVNANTASSGNSGNPGANQTTGNNGPGSNANSNSSNVNNNPSSVMGPGSTVSAAVAVANKNSAVTGAASASAGGAGGSGMVPNIQMVSQYIQTGLPYYQQPVYSYEELQMMQQRVPHVQGYYDLNYTPTSLGAGRDNLGSVAYSAMTDGRFARTDNNSSPVSNVSSTMSQQAGSSGPMLNVPYYFYGGNVMPGSFQYGTPAIYSQQIPAPNTASGGQFPKPSYNTGYGSTSYDTLSQATQDYTKGGYPSSVNQPNKPQNVSNQPPAGTGTDIASSMYGKGHVAINKVNSYEKQNFHSGTPPPFNMPNTQTAGGTSAQPYGMYLPMPATAGHHNMIHQPIHQMDGRIHNSSRRDSNSTGQRQQTNSQSKPANKQGYSPSYWTGQN